MDRLIDALGGPDALDSSKPTVISVAHPSSHGQESSEPKAIPLARGRGDESAGPHGVKLVLASRYELDLEPVDTPPSRLLGAFDRATKQNVTLAFPVQDRRAATSRSDLRSHVAHARSVSHPNVCRVHDAIDTPWGAAFVTEALAGKTLEAELAARARMHREFGLEEFRHLATDCFAGLAAVHARGLVHGDATASHIVLLERKAVLLCLGLARARQVDGDTGETTRTPADDVLILARTLWSIWTAASEPSRPRGRPLKAQVRSDIPQRLSADELRNLFRALSDDPAVRPLARRVRFHATRSTPTATLFVRHHIDAGPPEASGSFVAGRHALLVTYAGTAPELVGTLLPLVKQCATFGRSPRADLTVSERTVSAAHASFKWQKAGWILEDLGSTNGVYAEVGYERQNRILLRHGAEAQLGELRVMLVGFDQDSRRHRRAREFLSRRDGLTGLLTREAFAGELDEDGALADWAELPMQLILYELSVGQSERQNSIIATMLALRHSSRRVVEMTEAATVALCPVPGGIINTYRPRVDASPPQFGVSLVGLDPRQARHMAEAIASQLRGTLPPGISLRVHVIARPPAVRARVLLEDASLEDPITVC